MRLLGIFSTDRILGGGEISFTLTLRAAQSNGCHVLAGVTAEGQLSAYLVHNKIPFAVLPQEPLRGLRVARLVQPDPAWVDLVNEYQPDVIHCNAVRAALYAQAAGRRCQVPVILHARKDIHDPTDSLLSARMDGIICTSNVVEKRFQRNDYVLIRVIFNPIDTDEFQHKPRAAGMRQQWSRTADDFLIGLPGRFSHIKGQHRLVAAAPIVAAQCGKARFVLIGEEDEMYPGYTAGIKKTVEAARLRERVVFAGFHEDMFSAYAALDAVVFPTSAEAFGRVVIEAGAAGKPLVANNIEVLREILPTPSDDFLVNCENPAQFAARIVRIINDPPFRESLIRRLQEHVNNTFTLKAHWEQISKMYADVLERFRARPKYKRNFQ